MTFGHLIGTDFSHSLVHWLQAVIGQDKKKR